VADPNTEKLLAEAELLRAQARDTARSPFSRPTTWLPLLLAVGTAIGGLLTGYYSWQVKQIEVSEATQQARGEKLKAQEEALTFKQTAFDAKQEAESSRAENERLRDEIASLNADVDAKLKQIQQASLQLAGIQAKIAEAQAALSAKSDIGMVDAALLALTVAANSAGSLNRELNRSEATVYVQFTGTITRDTVQNLLSMLRTFGYVVPASEKVKAANFSTEVRYFHPEDKAAADDVAQAVAAFLTSACQVDQVVPSKQLSLPAKLGNIEVWIKQDC
jgi:DNA repair exonuclease SbcCD ATPase subunit